MNKIYKSKWSRVTQTWVATSELTKGMGKAAAVVSLMALSNSAFAADCVAAADGSFLPGNTDPSCNNVVAATTTQSGGADYYILTRSHLHETLTVGSASV